MPNDQLWVFSRSREIWRRLEAEVLFFWVTNECVSIHFPTCLRGNFCFLYCLILLQALNCCPQEDAKRYNRNSFVLSRLLSRPFFCKSFFLSFLFLHLTGFFSSFWQHGDHQSDDLHFSSVIICFCCIFCPLSVLCLVHFSLQPSLFVSSVLCAD